MRDSIVAISTCRATHENMSRKHNDKETPAANCKNEASPQICELFHRAIAHAKASNTAAMDDTEKSANDGDAAAGPLLSIVR